ncbi:hypothetical protein H4R33_006149 [Dimargaris cristalligena]|nr:hypothetical protein H4R33_006149 [Dimargaris cristalligena]
MSFVPTTARQALLRSARSLRTTTPTQCSARSFSIAPVAARAPTLVDTPTQSVEQGQLIIHESTLPTAPADPTVARLEVLATQAPNRVATWSANQRPRDLAMRGPRFVQTDIPAQPQPMSAMELIAEEPIRMVEGRKATCDGGGGPLGHPKIYINLDQDGIPHACGYCGLRFQQSHAHH